jgi:hypothetical protein
MGKKKSDIASIVWMMLLMTVIATAGIYLFKHSSNLENEANQKSSEVITELNEQTSLNNILLVTCGDQNVRDLKNLLERYGRVTMDTKVEDEYITNYNIIVLYNCPLTESQDTILSHKDEIKWIGILDVGDNSFREQMFSVVNTDDLESLPLERDSYLINNLDNPIVSYSQPKERLRPLRTSIGFFKKAECNGISLSTLDPFDPALSESDSSSAICVSGRRLYFSFDIARAIEEKQGMTTITETLDYFINKYSN